MQFSQPMETAMATDPRPTRLQAVKPLLIMFFAPLLVGAGFALTVMVLKWFGLIR